MSDVKPYQRKENVFVADGMEGEILSLYCIGRSKRNNNFLCKLPSLDIKRRFNKAVSSSFLPQLFVFSFYF